MLSECRQRWTIGTVKSDVTATSTSNLRYVKSRFQSWLLNNSVMNARDDQLTISEIFPLVSLMRFSALFF